MNLSEQYRSRLKVLAGIPLNESIQQGAQNPLYDFESYIDLVFNSVNEDDKPSPTFEWDIAKEKIDNSTGQLKTAEQAEEYLIRILEKIKSIPKSLKLKILKYIAFSLVGLIGYGTLQSVVYKNAPEISKELNIAMASKSVEKNKANVLSMAKVEPRKSSDSLVDILKHEEGSIKDKGEPVLTPYKLGDGMITVGWGHAERIGNSKFRIGQKITREKAEELLAADIAEAERGLNIILDDWKSQGIKVRITQPMYDAMVSMIFNMGIGNFRKSDFIQLVKKGKYEQAAERILTTNVTYPGHVPRRQKESELFSRGIQA
jgi:lysozyme